MQVYVIILSVINMELNIKNLSVNIGDKEILKDFNINIKPGEIHVLMGPNGVGKSTLTKVIMGDNHYTITSGSITYGDKDLLKLSVSERAQLGIFLGMQLPPEIEGVTNADFMHTALREKEKDNFKLFPFIKRMDLVYDELKMNKEMIHRGVNVGFSGGERKKNEIMQILMLEPSFIMLDEIDSGLDVDALKIVGDEVMKYYDEKKPGILLITHYDRLLDYIKPTHVHVVVHGKVVKSGNYTLVKEIEENGYKDYE